MSKIAFIGAGNMNGAIISGLVKQGFPPENIMVTNPSPEKRVALHTSLGIRHSASNIEAAEFADYIVLGVKPHFIEQVCQEISSNVDVKDKCVISVAAGSTIAKIEQALGSICAIIRTMPNTPATLGLGITGLYAAPQTSAKQKLFAQEVMSAVGIIKWLDKEEDIDHITAISGSGPAYFYLFMEAMQQQAMAFGFSEQDSREIVQQTAIGAAKMVIETPVAIDELRARVTSKGGTTHAAIESFKEDGLSEIVTKAMNSALHRAKELAQDTPH